MNIVKKTLNQTMLIIGLMSVSAIAIGAPAAKNVNIRQEMINNCVAQGQAVQIGDQATLKKLCTCTIGVQADNLTVGEFWDIQGSAMSGKDPRSLKAVQRIQPKLDACSKGLKLNNPVMPKPAK